MLFSLIRGELDLSKAIISFVSYMVVIFVTLPIHEWAHGFASTRLGDPTPRYQGRLTLNPLAHIDWLGALGILVCGIGWAKPVQVNARYYKSPKWGMALVAFAGPMSNILTAFVVKIIFNLVVAIFSFTDFLQANPIWYTMIYLFFDIIAYVSVNLAVFNLIPIPPFDGSRILFTFLPQKYYFKIMQYERFIFIGILILLYTGILSFPLEVITSFIMLIIEYIANLPFNLLGVLL